MSKCLPGLLVTERQRGGAAPPAAGAPLPGALEGSPPRSAWVLAPGWLHEARQLYMGVSVEPGKRCSFQWIFSSGDSLRTREVSCVCTGHGVGLASCGQGQRPPKMPINPSLVISSHAQVSTVCEHTLATHWATG